MPRGDLLDDPSRHRFIGNFSSRPLADGTLFGLLTGHRDQLASLLCADLASPAGAWDITESVVHREIGQRHALPGKPAFAPSTHRLHTQAQLAGNLAIVLACIGL